MKNVIKWLHLSDFHVGKDDYGQKQLFNEIIEHVKIQKEKGVVPDYLFITGDLADRGQDKQYDLFNKSFLEPLQAVIGNDIDKRTFTVPGNHDVDRAQSPGFGVDKFLELQSAYFDPTELGLSRRKILFERFASFCTYDQTITLGSWLTSEDGAYSYVDENNSLGIVGINTAWLCEGENDERQLSPGKALVENILKKIQHCNTKIVLGHHPINWFSLKHQRPIQALFGKNNVIYLHGHLHEAWLAPQYGSGEPFLAIQSGAAFQEREHEQYKNGFLWAELNQGNGLLKLQPRSWNINNQDWSLSEAFPEGNRVDDFWYFELPGQKKKVN
jgi:predicted phosphodiesterase